MKPGVIEGHTRMMGEGQAEYLNVPIRDALVDGVPVMLSVWELTERERAEIAAGGNVRLAILGTSFPPVRLTTDPPPPLVDEED